MAGILVLGFSGGVHAKIEWNISDNISLEDKPLDMAISKDGLTTYILCEDKVLLYSTQENKVTDTIPVTEPFTRIALSPDGERLFLTNPDKKEITVIQVMPIYDIEIGQSPVIGRPDAPVSIVAFLDFQ
jgi:DNA-binding beta-propeller fold protein YncE